MLFIHRKTLFFFYERYSDPLTVVTKFNILVGLHVFIDM